MIIKDFHNELERRKYKILVFLSTLFLIAGLFATVILVYLAAFIPGIKEEPADFLTLGLGLFITLLFAFVRFYYLKRHSYNSFIIIITLFSIVALTGAFQDGVFNPAIYIIILLMVLCTSIIVSVSRAILYSAILSFIIISIAILQSEGILTYSISEDFMIVNSVMYLVLIGIGTYIVKVGYEQIEHSYEKAYDYARELEELNKSLDEKVKLRTRQLTESLDRQAESVHTAAVMGSITKPMLHDLATPLSSLNGALKLLTKENLVSKRSEITHLGIEAVNQIERIINDARQLMDNKDLVVEFSPFEVISAAIFVLKYDLQKAEIKVKLNIDGYSKLKGVVGIFERIVINIIINAIEELRQCQGKREINIEAKNEGNYFILTIRDSGRGVKEENFTKIFEPDFTLKTERNLGFGLPFVKDSIEKKFNGEISVESKLGKYTRFILKFDKTFNVVKPSESDKVKR